jgi:hypothetical protein
MSSLLLFLSSFVLNLSPVNLFFAPLLGSFVPLSDDKFGVDNLFVFFHLALHNFELGFFKNLHSSLLKSLAAKNIEHWLNLFIKVEQLVVTLENLSGLAAIL